MVRCIKRKEIEDESAQAVGSHAGHPDGGDVEEGGGGGQ